MTMAWVRRIATAAATAIVVMGLLLIVAILKRGPANDVLGELIELRPLLLWRIGGVTLAVFGAFMAATALDEFRRRTPRDPE